MSEKQILILIFSLLGAVAVAAVVWLMVDTDRHNEKFRDWAEKDWNEMGLERSNR
jgi:hypothetical protein